MKIRSWLTPLNIGILCCTGAIGSARATTLARMTLAQMAYVATDIVRARCIANTTHWDNGELWTFTTFEVQETWRGSATGRITVRLLGGRTPQFTSIVSGVPQFRPGEDVILFLESVRENYSVVSWQQGTFRIRRDSTTGEERVTQDTASFETYDFSTRRSVTSGIHKLPIGEFRSKVEAALAKGRGNKGGN